MSTLTHVQVQCSVPVLDQTLRLFSASVQCVLTDVFFEHTIRAMCSGNHFCCATIFAGISLGRSFELQKVQMQPAAFWQLVAFVDIVLTQQMCIFFVKLSSFVCVCTLCVPQSRSALFSMRL